MGGFTYKYKGVLLRHRVQITNKAQNPNSDALWSQKARL